MPVTFLAGPQHREMLLTAAAALTYSEGFMNDAQPIGAVDKSTGELLAVAVFQNITTRGAEVHFGATGPRALRRRDVMTGFCAFAFNPRMPIRAGRLTAPIAAWNEPALVAALRSGFTITGFIGGGALDGSDAIMAQVERETCRWLPPPRHAAEETTGPVE